MSVRIFSRVTSDTRVIVLPSLIKSELVFYVINLDVRQSRQANDSANVVKRAKERFCNSEMLKKAQQEAK